MANEQPPDRFFCTLLCITILGCVTLWVSDGSDLEVSYDQCLEACAGDLWTWSSSTCQCGCSVVQSQ